MKNAIISLLCAITIISHSCIGKGEGPNDFKEFNLAEIATEVKLAMVKEEGSVVLPTNCIVYNTKLMLSDLFTEIDAVPLESSEGSLIGGIDKLLFCDSTLIGSR